MSELIYSKPITAVIFDNDGTLMDTEWIYSEMHQVFTGQPMTPELKGKLLGCTPWDIARITIEHCHLNETVSEFREKMHEYLDCRWPHVKMLPGATDVIQGFWDRKVRMSIATSTAREEFTLKSSNHQDIMNMIDYSVTGSDVSQGKPSPEIFLKTLHMWNGAKPENTLVFEDSPKGIKAANLAGMPSVFIPNKLLNPELSLKLADANATQILSSLTQFNWKQWDIQPSPSYFYNK